VLKQLVRLDVIKNNSLSKAIEFLFKKWGFYSRNETANQLAREGTVH